MISKIKNSMVCVFQGLLFISQRVSLVFQRIMSMSFVDWMDIVIFQIQRVPPKSVLLVEINFCHGEVILGYVKYLLDLGYNVNIVAYKSIFRENLFCRMQFKKIRAFRSSFLCNRFFLKNKKIFQYQHVILTSSISYFWRNNQGAHPAVQTMFPLLQQHRSLLIVEHSLSNIVRLQEEEMLSNNQIIVLGRFPQGVMVNPHYFGDVLITGKSDKTRFIVVGEINPIRKNYSLLIGALTELIETHQNFEIIIVGRGDLDDLPKDIQHYVQIKGRLGFSEMFDEMEKADFFFPLLDPENPAQQRYITTGVTGSVQLIYGFCKPCLIHRMFASFYSFNRDNSLIYDENMLEVMQQAIDMKKEDYLKMQNELQQLASDIYQESLQNLKNILLESEERVKK